MYTPENGTIILNPNNVELRFSQLIDVLPENQRKEWNLYLANCEPTIKSSLVCCAAYHPLEEGINPGPLYRRCLEYTRELSVLNLDSRIAVAGSRHRYEEHRDRISLARSGSIFLSNYSLPAIEAGNEVYNTGNEIREFAKIATNRNLSPVHILAEPWIDRAILYWVRQGFIPEIHAIGYTLPPVQRILERVTVNALLHNFIETNAFIDLVSRYQRRA